MHWSSSRAGASSRLLRTFISLKMLPRCIGASKPDFPAGGWCCRRCSETKRTVGMSPHDKVTSTGRAVTLTWPEPDIALATMTREREMNPLSLELLEELDAALTASVAGSARALIITGQGKAFCAGAHLRYFTSEDARIGSGSFALRDRYLQPIATLFDRIETLPIPVIAAINGFALGGGCEMSLACDFRLMADSTKIGVPEVRIGALAGAGGVQKLPRLVGRGKATEWVLVGRHVTPQEALAHGLLTSVHPAAE